MGADASPGSGAFAGLASGFSKSVGQAMLLDDSSGTNKNLPAGQSSGFDWSRGFGEAQFGPDKIGIRDATRGLFGLPK
jgi:hypothetical protein